MSNQVNTDTYELIADHISFWAREGNDMWCEVLERLSESTDLEAIKEKLTESAQAMCELEMSEVLGYEEY